MASLVAAAGGVEFPRDVDADTAGVIVLTELCADVDSTVGCHFRESGMQNIICKDGYAQALIFKKLFAKT